MTKLTMADWLKRQNAQEAASQEGGKFKDYYPHPEELAFDRERDDEFARAESFWHGVFIGGCAATVFLLLIAAACIVIAVKSHGA